MPTIHLLVKGRVQGVFYRASAKNAAEALGLSGWVRNTLEGDVEIVVSGNAEVLQNFRDWCKKGPANAWVISVTVSNMKEESFSGFRILK